MAQRSWLKAGLCPAYCAGLRPAYCAGLRPAYCAGLRSQNQEWHSF